MEEDNTYNGSTTIIANIYYISTITNNSYTSATNSNIVDFTTSATTSTVIVIFTNTTNLNNAYSSIVFTPNTLAFLKTKKS